MSVIDLSYQYSFLKRCKSVSLPPKIYRAAGLRYYRFGGNYEPKCRGVGMATAKFRLRFNELAKQSLVTKIPFPHQSSVAWAFGRLFWRRCRRHFEKL